MLDTIQGPADLRNLSYEQLDALAAELRANICQVVSRNGGHLASNLGTVEMTLALHRVYDAPRDKIIFDVGHQSYAHKLLTGRAESFSTLRQEDGLSGFPTRAESEYDAFGAGHASTAVSAALGFSRARDALGEDYRVVAVVGDGALTGGEAYEALNDAGRTDTPMVVIINDNGMSIDVNIGGLTKHLNRLRSSRGYWRMKNALTVMFEGIPKIGKPLYHFFQTLKNSIKYLFYRGQFFDALGFVYLGPVDGHSIREMEHTLLRARALSKPVIVHIVTRKGKGMTDAENAPDQYHGIAGSSDAQGKVTCSDVVGAELIAMADLDGRICAITAAMPQGTGLDVFALRHPERFYDVGIAEEHAATMCAAMAAAGMRPYFAVYSTFMQRCFDQMAHDVALQDLSATFLVDRAGLVGDDGATHQGVFDIALCAMLPHFSLWAPRSAAALRAMLRQSPGHQGPLAIRYPKALPLGEVSAFKPGHWEILRQGEGPVVLAVGPMVYEALDVADAHDAMVVSVESVIPMDEELLRSLAGRSILTVEEGSDIGGFGALVRRVLDRHAVPVGKLRTLGTPREVLPHASAARQKGRYCLDAEGIGRALSEMEDILK